MPVEPEKFAALFGEPSLETMYALSPTEFEHFVAYVLRRAGYDVKEVGPHFLRGVDLEMRVPGKASIFGGVECKRFASDVPVRARVVMSVMGAPAVSKRSAKPFVITTSDFNDAAYKMAKAGAKRVYLVNGVQLIRYIRYIQGSRRNDDDVITSLSPEFFEGQGVLGTVSSTKILTIANNKGGVGKTTTSYYLGAELARMGERVLLIDLDGQANLTEWCFPELSEEHDSRRERFPNIASYFSGEKTLSSLIVSTGKERLSIIPSDPFLTLRDLGGSGRPKMELQFMQDIQKLGVQPIASLSGVPDWIIIDTPPAMSAFTRAGLAAAQYVLAPMRPRRVSLAGTRNMLKTLQTMNALRGTPVTFLGILITHWDDLMSSQNFLNLVLPLALQEYGYGDKVFTSKIPIDNQLETLEPGAKTVGAKAYMALAEEVKHDVHTRQRVAIEVRN